MKSWKRFKAWLRTVSSKSFWVYLKYKRRSKTTGISGMSVAEAKRCGFICEKSDRQTFDTMDAWPVETLEAPTLESVANGVRDLGERTRLKKLIAEDNARRVEAAQVALGTGRDVNSMAWQELMERMNQWKDA